MAGGQQINISQGSVGVSIGGGASVPLIGTQISAVAGNVSNEFVIEDTFITVSTGTARATFGVPLVNKQVKP